MKTALVVGCSMTQGQGLCHTIDNPKLWANQLLTEIGCTSVNNLARSGANNHWIFLETIGALLRQPYDIVIVGWSAIPRFNITVGLELYPTYTRLAPGGPTINVNDYESFDSNWLADIGDRLLRLHNDHWDLLDLVKYVNTLIELQEQTRKGHIFFVNTLGPWPANYFTKKNIQLPTDLSDFEQLMLHVKTRDDEEILKLYNMVHDQYSMFGGIRESNWLNLYNSMHQFQVDDAAPDDIHPGLLSQDIFFNFIKSKFKEKLNIQC